MVAPSRWWYIIYQCTYKHTSYIQLIYNKQVQLIIVDLMCTNAFNYPLNYETIDFNTTLPYIKGNHIHVISDTTSVCPQKPQILQAFKWGLQYSEINIYLKYFYTHFPSICM